MRRAKWRVAPGGRIGDKAGMPMTHARPRRFARRPGLSRIAAAAIALATFGGGAAADPTGTWRTEDGDGQVRIAACGAALCGHVIRLKDPIDPATGQPATDKNNVDPKLRARPALGLQILTAMKPNGKPNEWGGRVYNPFFGRVFAGRLVLESDTRLKVEGCYVGICDHEIWTRAK